MTIAAVLLLLICFFWAYDINPQFSSTRRNFHRGQTGRLDARQVGNDPPMYQHIIDS